MTKMKISFHECEHHGDLQYYIDDLLSCGAVIVSSKVDTESETGYVTINVDNERKFLNEFSETDSWGFSSLAL